MDFRSGQNFILTVLTDREKSFHIHDNAHQVEETLKAQFEGVEDVVVHLEPEGHHHEKSEK